MTARVAEKVREVLVAAAVVAALTAGRLEIERLYEKLMSAEMFSAFRLTIRTSSASSNQ